MQSPNKITKSHFLFGNFTTKSHFLKEVCICRLNFFHKIRIIEEENTQDNTQDRGAYMGDYKPLFKITNKILSYVSSISEKIGQITVTGWNHQKCFRKVKL